MFAPLCVALVTSACDDASTPAAVAEDVATQDFYPEEVQVGADIDNGDNGGNGVVAPVEPRWPEGPYGIGYMDVIANESFFDPFTGETVRLSDYYADPAVNGIVIVSAAGWCSACSYESWDLVEAMDKYRDDGLVILYTLYEDTRGRPLWEDGASYEVLDRDMTFMTDYRENLGGMVNLTPRVANFPVLIDIGFTLSRYFHRNATPLTIILRASDMRIVYKEVGYSSGTVDLMIKSTLFSK